MARPQIDKRAYFIVQYALTVSNGIYLLLGYLMAQSPSRAAMPMPKTVTQLMLEVVAAVCLFASMAYMQFRTGGKSGDVPAIGGSQPPLMEPKEFQSETVVGMALAEACSVLGLLLFFMGMPLPLCAVRCREPSGGRALLRAARHPLLEGV